MKHAINVAFLLVLACAYTELSNAKPFSDEQSSYKKTLLGDDAKFLYEAVGSEKIRIRGALILHCPTQDKCELEVANPGVSRPISSFISNANNRRHLVTSSLYLTSSSTLALHTIAQVDQLCRKLNVDSDIRDKKNLYVPRGTSASDYTVLRITCYPTYEAFGAEVAGFEYGKVLIGLDITEE